MARKTAEIRIDQDGRDHGKMFFLTEMPASKAERWAMRAFFAMMNAGVSVPDEVKQLGLVGMRYMDMASIGAIPYEAAAPLLEEMFQCIEAVPDPAKPEFRRSLVETDIEEIKTRLFLRLQVVKLHTDFFSKEKASK